ncbi:Chemotaxis protein CheY [uncultured archaeon]|nr:Chemotaxis protein CheY [uncultured archaeon]
MEGKRILVIDDDKVILKGFQILLESKGYQVSTAETGQAALEKVRDNFYNLALIDIKLPDMEGTALLREFHQLNPEMKKIIVTGFASRENAIESLNQGANGYLEKPVTPGRLLEFVADKLAEQDIEIRHYEDTVDDLLKSRK